MRVAGVLACLALLACGSRRPHSAHVTEPTRLVSLRRSAGLEVATLRRPMGERVWLALYLDAGSRDADPPQAATLAALMAAGQEVHARVSPDATEFAVDCRRGELPRCARRLASVMATRGVSRDDLAAASRELQRRRQRAAEDDARQADRLALEALFGPGVTPLGDASRDDEADGDVVGRFFESHYGPTRALLVAVGEVDEASVDAAAEAFADAPAALDEAGSRGAARSDAALTGEGESRFVAAAVASSSVAQARGLGRALSDPLLGDPELRVHVFPLRGAAVTLVRLVGATAPADQARALVTRISGLARDGNAMHGDPETGSTAIDRARAFAARWTARLPEEAASGERAPALAIGIVAPEPPDANALEALWSDASPARAEGDAENASVHVGGAQVVARRWPGAPRVSVALSLLGGAAEEPPALHGRSAVLAHVMAERCGLDAGRLSERLRSLGGRATAVVEAERLGVVFELPRAHWREAVDLTARCTLRAPSVDTDVDGVRGELLTHRTPEDELAERAARLLAPNHPGRVAPEGSGVALARLTLGELEQAHAELVVRARVRAVIVGDMPADDAATRLARWLLPLPEGHAPTLEEGWPHEREDALANPETRGDTPRVLLALRVPDGDAAIAPALREVARNLGRRLTGDGVRLETSGAGSDRHGSWLSVQLAVESESIDDMPARVAAALRELGGSATAHAPAPSTTATAAWRLTREDGRAPSTDLIQAFARATPILQIRGVGRSPTLQRLAP